MKSAASVMTDLSYSNHLPLLACRSLRRKLATIRETTLQHAVELALDLVQAAQDQEEAVGAGHDHQSNSERKKEAPAFTSGRASIGRELRSSAPVWESGRRRYLSHILGPNVP